MGDATLIITLLVLLFAGKAVVVAALVHRKSRRRTNVQQSSPFATTAAEAEIPQMTGPSVLVEDPMTQRYRSLLLAAPEEQFCVVQLEPGEDEGDSDNDDDDDDDSTAAPTTPVSPPRPLLPPPAYTPKDRHFEFADVPPPPSFSATMARSKRKKINQKSRKSISGSSLAVSPGSTEMSPPMSSASSSTGPSFSSRARALSLPTILFSTDAPIPPTRPHPDQQHQIGIEMQGVEQAQEQGAEYVVVVPPVAALCSSIAM